MRCRLKFGVITVNKKHRTTNWFKYVNYFHRYKTDTVLRTISGTISNIVDNKMQNTTTYRGTILHLNDNTSRIYLFDNRLLLKNNKVINMFNMLSEIKIATNVRTI